MMIQLQMGAGFEKTVAELGSMGDAIRRACSVGLKKGVKLAAGKVVSEHLSGQDLKRRSGRLAEAVDGWMAGELEGVVGVQEHSGAEAYKWILGTEQKTITPKKAKFLTIPIGENLTQAGVARYSSPRDVPDGFFFTGKSGGLFFGTKRGKRGKVRPLFVLKKSVTVTGSGALAAGVLDSADDITEAMTDEIARTTGAN